MQKLELPAFDEASWSDVNELYGRNPGIYRVKLKNATLESYQPIPRLLGVDDGGLLYIGMSDAIIGRFGGLRTGIYGAYRFKSSSGRIYNAPAAHKIDVKCFAASMMLTRKSAYSSRSKVIHYQCRFLRPTTCESMKR